MIIQHLIAESTIRSPLASKIAKEPKGMGTDVHAILSGGVSPPE